MRTGCLDGRGCVGADMVCCSNSTSSDEMLGEWRGIATLYERLCGRIVVLEGVCEWYDDDATCKGVEWVRVCFVDVERTCHIAPKRIAELYAISKELMLSTYRTGADGALHDGSLDCIDLCGRFSKHGGVT